MHHGVLSSVTPISTTQAPGYQPPTSGALDEIFAPDGTPRPHARRLATELGALGPEALADAGRRRDAIFVQQGITFDATGKDGPVRDRPFPLDLVPRILTSSDWEHLEAGLRQRITA